MTVIFNDAGKNSLADGVAITSANNGGGGNALLTNAGTIAPIKRIGNGPPAADPSFYELPALTSAQSSYVSMLPGTWTASVGGSCGAWWQFTANPAATIPFMRFGQSGNFYVGMTATGKIVLVDTGTSLFTSVLTIQFNVWYWITMSLSAASTTTGVMRIGIRDKWGTALESNSYTNRNTTAVTSTTSYFGRTTTGVAPLMRVAGLRASNTNDAIMIPTTARGRGMEVAA